MPVSMGTQACVSRYFVEGALTLTLSPNTVPSPTPNTNPIPNPNPNQALQYEAALPLPPDEAPLAA